MAKEVVYRRSFHCDRDLRGMENMFGLEKALIGRKSGADWRLPSADGGLEAPRNSLDVPSLAVEIPRRSEARCEDIPIGYELSRSLTSRRKPEEFSVYKFPIVLAADYQSNLRPTPKIAPLQVESEQKPRAPSVVARLMGLEAMPQDAATNEFSKRISGERHSSNHSFRRLLLQEFCSSQDERVLSKQASVSAVPSQRDISIPQSYADNDEKLPHAELPFRNHPQEKQLQEFKKEFAARQAMQGRNRHLSDRDVNLESPELGGKLADTLPSAKRFSGSETLHESKEFQDALEFLHSNKEFFVKVLNDPSSLFAKHLQRVTPSAKETLRQKTESQLKGRLRFVRSFSEPRRESPISPYTVKGFPESKGKQDASQFELKEQGEWMAEWQPLPASKFRPDEEMPIRHQRRGKCISPSGIVAPKRGRSTCSQTPTRIVVLKPNPEKYSNAKSCSPTSPMPRSNVSFNVRAEGKENAKAISQEAKEKVSVGASKKQLLAARGQSTDGLKDPRNIAREIVKQAKDDMSRKLLKEAWESSSFTRSSSIGRRLSPQGTGFHGDASGTSDGEGYCTPSRRISRDNGKSYSSLPSSPRLHRYVDDESRAFSLSGRKGGQAAHADAGKRSSSRLRVPTQSSREMSRDVDAALEIFNVPESCTGLDVDSSVKSLRGKRVGSQTKNNRLREPESKGGSPKVLPRSLSVPTITTVENRILAREQKERRDLERTNCSSKSRSAENSLFKGRLLSLKDSFSLAKRTRHKKISSPTQQSSCSESPEIASPRQPNSHQSCDSELQTPTKTKEQSLLLSDCHWQTVSTTPQHDLRKKMGEAMERCLNGMLSDGSLTPIDLHQWVTTNDAVDSSSESSMDKCEQPSPVSVLETPFQEESPSPVDLRENASKCSDLRLELSLTQPEYKRQFLNSGGDKDADCLSRHILDASSAEGEPFLPCNSSDNLSESLSLIGTSCPAGREDELKYIRDILAHSGFTSDGAIAGHAFSPTHGLNPAIFEKLEQQYHEKEANISVMTNENRQGSLDVSNRRLLFDAVDEFLSEKLGTPVNQSWLKSANTMHRSTYTGKQLLEQTWADILNHTAASFESQDESFDDLASRDLAKAAPWVHAHADLEMVVIELEHLILKSLVAEVFLDCKV